MAGSAFKLTVFGSKPRANKLETTLTSSLRIALKKSSYEPAIALDIVEINPYKTVYFNNVKNRYHN